MKLIVGLGNPEGRYAKTRHNAGFMVVDRLLGSHAKGEVLKARFQAATAEVSLGGERCLLMKPTTYMNKSGQSVGEAVRFFKVDPKADLLIVVDELYLPTGSLKLSPKGGTAGHNGLTDIHRILGTDEYPRLRVGVGLQPSGGKPPMMDQADFVLGQFSEEERDLLEGALGRAAKAAEAFALKGLDAAMNAFNGADPARAKKAKDRKESVVKPPVTTRGPEAARDSEIERPGPDGPQRSAPHASA